MRAMARAGLIISDDKGKFSWYIGGEGKYQF